MLSHQLKQHVIDGEKTIIQNPTDQQRCVWARRNITCVKGKIRCVALQPKQKMFLIVESHFPVVYYGRCVLY